MEIDISLHNKMKSSFSKADFRLYILRDNPMKSSFEYGTGLANVFDGVLIHIAANAIRNSNKVKDEDPFRLHSIQAHVRNEENQLINKPENDKCAIHFEDQTLFLHVKKNQLWLAFKDKKTGKENLKDCFKIQLPADYFTED